MEFNSQIVEYGGIAGISLALIYLITCMIKMYFEYKKKLDIEEDFQQSIEIAKMKEQLKTANKLMTNHVTEINRRLDSIEISIREIQKDIKEISNKKY